MTATRQFVAAISLIMAAGLPGLAAHADAHADRRACWENYAICASGAGDINSWRSVCYSDYTVCMKNPQPVECVPAGEDYCEAARLRCEVRNTDLENGKALCDEDHQVCLDTHGC